MAATLSNQQLVCNVPFTVEVGWYTTLQEGVTITHTHLNHATLAPSVVSFTVTERPTTRDVVSCYWDRSANDTTNGTIALQFDTTPGGDLTGAEVMYCILWLPANDGGIS